MRLVACCVAFVVGDACALADGVGWRAGAGAALIAGGLLVLARGRRMALASGIAFFALGAALGTRAARPAPPHPAVAAAFERDEAQEIVGTVTRGPESTGTGARLVVAMERVAGAQAI